MTKESAVSTRSTFRRIRTQFLLPPACLALAATLFAAKAQAGAILVGKTPGACTKYTLQSAIEAANSYDGYNIIIVTDDAPSGEYRENVHVDNLKPNLQLDIRGGYRSCTDLTPSGNYTRVRGASTGSPVLRLGGSSADVSITGLHFPAAPTASSSTGPSGCTFRATCTSRRTTPTESACTTRAAGAET